MIYPTAPPTRVELNIAYVLTTFLIMLLGLKGDPENLVVPVCLPSELKEAQRRQQQKEERFRQEEEISNTSLVWNQHILPRWDAMWVMMSWGSVLMSDFIVMSERL